MSAISSASSVCTTRCVHHRLRSTPADLRYVADFINWFNTDDKAEREYRHLTLGGDLPEAEKYERMPMLDVRL